MSGSAYPPPSEQAPIFNSSLFPTTTTSTSSGSYLTYPVAQLGLETLSSIQVNGTASFVSGINMSSTAITNALTVNTIPISNGSEVHSTIIGVGSGNIAVGTGAYNTIFGFASAPSMTSSNSNNLFGAQAGSFLSYGTNNTIVGASSGSAITGNSYNTIVGNQAGNSIITGLNTCLGYNSNVNATSSNSTALGANSLATASNQIQLGTATTNVNCPATLSVAGAVTFTSGGTALALPNAGAINAAAALLTIGSVATNTITSTSTTNLSISTPVTSGGFINLNCQSAATPQISINLATVYFGCNTNYNGFNMTGASAIQAATGGDLTLRTPTSSTNSIIIAPAQITAVTINADGTTRFAQQTLYTYGTTITATVTLITAAPLKNFYIITAAAAATISLPTASATYAGSDITFRRFTNVAVITFNQTGGAVVLAPFNSNTLAASVSLTATQFSTRFTCDGTNWYQLATQ